ncbi:MAG: acyl carrier protein phosphodiesterase, partial [Bacteroidales bacterium]
SKSNLNPKYHKYSGIIIDIFYDHFLALEWENFSNEPLKEFVYDFYEILVSHITVLPKRVRQFLPIFILNNWLESYLSIEGIGDVLHRMAMRTSLPDYSKFAVSNLLNHYDKYRKDFYDYFPELIQFIERKHDIIINRPQ